MFKVRDNSAPNMDFVRAIAHVSSLSLHETFWWLDKAALVKRL